MRINRSTPFAAASVSTTPCAKNTVRSDSEILAEVYLELIGGRQPDLVLGSAAPAPAMGATGDTTWRPRPRPEPLPPRITEAETAAHAAMLAKLGDAAIWKQNA